MSSKISITQRTNIKPDKTEDENISVSSESITKRQTIPKSKGESTSNGIIVNASFKKIGSESYVFNDKTSLMTNPIIRKNTNQTVSSNKADSINYNNTLHRNSKLLGMQYINYRQNSNVVIDELHNEVT